MPRPLSSSPIRALSSAPLLTRPSARPRRWLPALVLVLGTLGGCAWAPGSHIAHESEAAPIDDLVEIRPITPGLVATYQETLGRPATDMPDELRRALERYEYRVGAGDVLDIIVYDHPELTIPAGSERSAAEAGNQVRNDGTIFYPFIGRVSVAGKTLDEIRLQLTRQLADYIAEPQVDVRVAAFRSKKVYVSGAVAEPSTLPVTTVPLTIVDAISQAGGAVEQANWHRATLTRNGQKIPVSLYALLHQGDQSENRLLRDGDILHVPTAEDRGISVMGQVRRPGSLPLGNEPLSLTDAVSQAGGIDETSAEPSGIFVIREKEEASDRLATVYQLDVSHAAAFAMGNDFILEPRDIVYVTTAPIARWNRVISLLLPSISLPGTLADTTTDVRDVNN
ncbi:polysaccharide export protein [Halomonas cerina]|uniref:Polysaccharide export outer membrane protein n=1 Tax=Halomonas cerina TaxID=447424 RepID=A0A839V6I9_9GAMM|nr:polysaccharide export protein [Halomonas cerina]MBB3189415.1 polysaccharide export outer membrane protein [Halomonas cerina]